MANRDSCPRPPQPEQEGGRERQAEEAWGGKEPKEAAHAKKGIEKGTGNRECPGQQIVRA